MELSPRRLELIRAANTSLRADRSMKDHLYRTRFEGRSVKVREAGDTVTVEYPRFAYGRRRANRSVVTLKGDLLWRIDCRGTLSELRADLGAIRLRSFEVQNAAARLLVTLPRPVGEVPIRLALGVRQATFQRPSGVAARVHIEKGAVGLALDDHRFKAGPVSTRARSSIAVRTSAGSVCISRPES